MKKILPYIMIASGASLWGIIAFFVKGLGAYDFTAMEIVAIRVIFAAVFLLIIGIVRYPKEMKLKEVKDVRLFVGTGILSIVFFNFCYFTTISQMNISVAVILLYTSPAFVTILSFIFLKESLTITKIAAVAGTILGCVLIAGISMEDSNITFLGIITGLGSGLGYALYTIFGKFALKKYQPFTITLYTFLIAAIALIPVTRLWTRLEILMDMKVLLYGIGLGLIPTVLAYFLYTWGLEKTEGSKAAIIATVEPVVATMLGVFLYGERLGVFQVIGALLILGSVLIVNLSFRKRRLNESGNTDIAQ
ncbi:DMT family transporter [Cytobacillus solani]|uniref:Transporter n=1 Tax=Cytobacillus solani TaxID=1637975 RepID=A0A0Q3TA45_9BACI|nr:EamA family transporter [Cytobacillus solani]KOP83178.1 transporter [Bacillus sp. FJAT-21945]KQL20205.1 transporter [Cytobacillus solani]USK53458.1 EamA family transporter [Cytobacillus solani]